jgi:anti-sigma factor RsiW
MSAVRDGIDALDLAAEVDGRLAPERAAALAAYLSAHPEEQTRLQQYQAQQMVLRDLLTADSGEPIPGRLRIERLRAEQRRRRSWGLAAVAAAIFLVLAGGAGGWLAHAIGIGVTQGNPQVASAETEITADALAAHRVFSVDVRHPVEVDATQEAHLVQWLSRRLGRPLVVPDLTSAGYKLMGGRLLPSENGPAAQFMYQSGNTRLTLYERSDSAGDTAFRYSEQNGIGEFFWSDQDFGYALAGKTDREQLLHVAELVYKQLSGDTGKAKPPSPPPQPPGKPS